MIRFYAAYIYSVCDWAYLYSSGSVCPRLNYFIRNLKPSFVFISLVPYDHDFISNSVIVIGSCGVFAICIFSICVCSCWFIFLQFAIWLIGRIMYLPKTNCPGLFCLVHWYVLCTTKSAAASIPIHGSESSTYVSCRLYVRKIFPSTWYIISMVAPSCGFPGESGFVLISYSCSIKLLLNFSSRNYPPRSYVISTGHGYRTSLVVSTNFMITITFLLLYCVISNHPVTRSIVVTAFRIKGYLTFIPILLGPMRSKNILSQGISSTSVAGNWLYLFDCFVRWHMSHYVIYFRTPFLMSVQYKFWRIISSVLSHPVWRIYVWYHFTM